MSLLLEILFDNLTTFFILLKHLFQLFLHMKNSVIIITLTPEY